MKLTDIKNSLNEISAIGGLKQVVKGNTDRVEGIKLSKEMAQAMIDWFNSSPYGRKYPKAAKGRLHLSLGIMSSMGLDRYAKHKGAKKELQYIKDLARAMRDNVNEAKYHKSKDEAGARKAEAIHNNAYSIIDMVMDEKRDAKEVVGTMGPALINSIKATLKHKFKPMSGREEDLKSFYNELKELLKVAESLVKRPSKAGVKKLKEAHREWWNWNFGADIVLNGKFRDSLVELNERDDAGTHLDRLADLVGKSKDFFAIGKELDKGGYKKKYFYSDSMVPMYQIEIDGFKFGIINKRYVDKGDREVGSTAIGLMESMKINEAKYDIGMARKGNGLTVYNKAEEEKGDYKNVAHIDNKGKIKYYDKKVPSKIKKQIEMEAKKMMEIKIEGTMKLTDLLNEDVYVKNKQTGNVYQVKNANPAKHEPPSKGEVEKAKTSDDNGSPKGGELKSEPKSDSPEVKAEKRKNLIDGKIDAEDGQDHADMLAKEVNMMDGQQAQKAVQHLLDKNNFSDYGSVLKGMGNRLKRSASNLAFLEKELDKAYDSDDEDRQMELTDKLNDGLAELGDMLNDLVENDDFSMSASDNAEEYEEKNESIREGKSMKLKDLLNESFEGMKVVANPFHTPFVKENEVERGEESNEMTNEQKMAFLEAVKSYTSFGETVYRKEGLAKVYESIRNVVEVAGKNMVKETEGSFDGITVGRHVKRMNESFKIFEKTLREVHTLQQRLESTYDEIGEVLGKYYEISDVKSNNVEEGNEFGAARAKAIAAGEDSFEVDGKKYPVKDVDKKDKENAKKFANESKSMRLTSLLNESFGIGDLPSSKLKKMKMSFKEVLELDKEKMAKLHKDGEVEVDGEKVVFNEKEKVDEKAPKMKSSPYVQKVRNAGLELAKVGNGMKFDDPNGFAKAKSSYNKAIKAIQNFQLDVTRFGKNY